MRCVFEERALNPARFRQSSRQRPEEADRKTAAKRMLKANDCIERQRRCATEPRVGARNERLPCLEDKSYQARFNSFGDGPCAEWHGFQPRQALEVPPSFRHREPPRLDHRATTFRFLRP